MPEMWEIEVDSLNKSSIRWKFLKQVETYFNWKDKNWSIIEVRKTGERIHYINFLICPEKFETKIIAYEYLSGDWKKMNERYKTIKINNLTKGKLAYSSDNYPYDVIVTRFKSDAIVQSFYFVSSTLSNKSETARIINSYSKNSR